MIDRTNRNFIAPSIQQQVQPQTTALAPVAPIKPSQLIDSHNTLLGIYQQQYREAVRVGEVLPPESSSAPKGYSSASELQPRNRRFFVTIGALVGVAAFGIWGIVGCVAHAAGFVGDNWTLPLWIALTGISAFLIIRSVHSSEQRLTPESIALNEQENQFAVAMHDAETRRLAIRYAGRVELDRVQLQHEQTAAQHEANHRLTLETQRQISDQMQRHTTPQSQLNRLNTYRQIAPNNPTCPQEQRQERPGRT